MRELGRALGVREEEEEGGDVEMKGAGGKGERFERVRSAVEKVIREGYSSVQVLSQVRPSLPRFRSHSSHDNGHGH